MFVCAKIVSVKLVHQIEPNGKDVFLLNVFINCRMKCEEEKPLFRQL